MLSAGWDPMLVQMALAHSGGVVTVWSRGTAYRHLTRVTIESG